MFGTNDLINIRDVEAHQFLDAPDNRKTASVPRGRNHGGPGS